MSMDASSVPEGPRPYWWPPDLDLDSMPADFRLAVREFLTPLYKALVVEVSDPLERAAGATIVFLMGVELREQFEMGRLVPDFSQPVSTRYKETLNRLLRVVEAKQQVLNFLRRFRVNRDSRDPLLGSVARIHEIKIGG
jgi:hypothetical protein